MDYKEIFDLILDENDFTVGGGSSSAIAGAMACGLMGMVANLSKGKAYGYTDEEYDAIIAELNDMKANFLQSAVDDNKAYMLIVNAYKLPKETDEQKAERKKAIQNAGIEAAKVPLLNALLNKRVNEIGKDLLEKSNPACKTDLKAGVDLSKVGLDSGKANVEVNLPLIKNEDIVNEFKEKMAQL
ncbi:cyclodeaminase/cyclohydrolase family protein [Peptoniphilus mikwangii]|uniref:cyclodeaminase/cyclohydrolase family protein n=1 Tax=Peptoniphilus mikwangii TaxID=1354300 RepID=UPI000404FA3D|nr:cyclodeaminase/cyclohydrolase family protein [Peptoniphilus mikwangii]